MEGIEPECGICPVPILSPEGRKVLELRGLLRQLTDLVDSGTILKMYDVNKDELELLAVAEGLLHQKSGPNHGGQHG